MTCQADCWLHFHMIFMLWLTQPVRRVTIHLYWKYPTSWWHFSFIFVYSIMTKTNNNFRHLVSLAKRTKMFPCEKEFFVKMNKIAWKFYCETWQQCFLKGFFLMVTFNGGIFAWVSKLFLILIKKFVLISFLLLLVELLWLIFAKI